MVSLLSAGIIDSSPFFCIVGICHIMVTHQNTAAETVETFSMMKSTFTEECLCIYLTSKFNLVFKKEKSFERMNVELLISFSITRFLVCLTVYQFDHGCKVRVQVLCYYLLYQSKVNTEGRACMRY